MSRAAALSGAVVALTLVAGCTGPAAGPICTQIGSETGISVRVEPDLAPDLRDLQLTVCIADDCTDHPVTLTAGASTVPDPCPSSNDPNAVCSAGSTPDGTAVGFVRFDALPTGTIKVSATGRLGANALTLAAAEITVQPTYPNGTGCPAGGNQANVSLSTAGVR